MEFKIGQEIVYKENESITGIVISAEVFMRLTKRTILFPEDIYVKWDTGQITTYDKDALEEMVNLI